MQQGYSPQQGNVTVVVPPEFGEKPVQVTCGNCRQTVITTTTAENGACAYIACIIVLIFCCPCFFIPLCIDSCKDIQHTCPGCGARLGTYKRV
ncbi:lipopolysaccharide-induced tumor necrosis factor-alpha factor homolog [Argiope bruennichi]|uniref:Lipopolysaccharide-induced tumor necrosis like protein n=1 Tax=Argiope bruennichi TaxID=94029 RepID=A0A8T0EY93_ARGBR|nr:lipopolysaccharide-induced tumor necrosis factor-alpha factor homolog [Argiope bruennichi]KAF8781709.1 Lipopolysaccharide-induced tumor necrosis like protein [Argiope bruennichi]